MAENNVADADEKFFFDVNVFDADKEDDDALEDLPPPPPTFTEAELSQAKRRSYEDGHKQATQEELKSREQHLATLIETISKEFSVLHAQEAAREKLYETETVNLCLSIFRKVFPHYNTEHGFDELKTAISTVIKSRSGKQSIRIAVHPDNIQGVETHLQALGTETASFSFTVVGEESLSNTQTQISWDHGGAVHSTDAIAQEIETMLQEILAGNGANRHDSNDMPPSAPTTQEPAASHPDLKETPDE